MKMHKFLFLFLLSSLLFSCTEDVLPEKPTLDRDELLNHISEMPEFQNYLQEIRAEVKNIIDKKRSISKKEFERVKLFHQKFPDLESFRAAADDNMYTDYLKLTGIDLVAGNPASQALFVLFTDKLKSEVIYEKRDFLNALFLLETYSLDETEKTQQGCSINCLINASQQQATIMNNCIQDQINELEPENMCRREARFDFAYSLRGGLTSCPQDE